jgi:sarcosine oxidase subunit gamma
VKQRLGRAVAAQDVVDEGMVEAPVATQEDVVAALKPILGEAASVTEQTGAWVRLEATGPLGPLFERLCNLDLARLMPGSATRTTIEHGGAFVVRRAADRMTLLGPRPSAASLHHALVAAARSAFRRGGEARGRRSLEEPRPRAR